MRKNHGITLIALVVTIVVLLILAAVSISMLTGENGVITQAQNSKEETDIADEKERVELAATAAKGKTNWGEITEDNLAEELTTNIGERDVDYTLTKEDGNFVVTYTDSKRSYLVDPNGKVGQTEIQLPEDKPDVSTEPEFTRANGVIEIEFLSGTSYHATATPNEPKMTSDMKKVYWENGEEKVEGESADFDKSKWYEYTAQTGNTETGGTSKWANAKTEDGSYWVWIPRYAYRIVYFDSKTHADAYRADNTQTTGIVGYSDARGIVDKDGKTPSDLQEPITSIAVGTNKLRPHPTFETDLNQGGWDSKIEGIWVAKYETSESGSKIKSIPGEQDYGIHYNSVKIGTVYTKAYEYDREKESHILKNSEWGAMAYLTESKYGRNGTEVSLNRKSYTAGGSGATPSTNPLQSTTGNEYGVYDTVGCSWEYIAGYIADSSSNEGNSFASLDNTKNNKDESTKYATVYKMSVSNTAEDNYKINLNKIFGDGITETSTSGRGTGLTSWHTANSIFVGDFPFISRGGGSVSTFPGTFSFDIDGNYANSKGSFRVCLIIK